MMKELNERIELSKKILDYWYTLEFFTQESFPIGKKFNMKPENITENTVIEVTHIFDKPVLVNGWIRYVAETSMKDIKLIPFWKSTLYFGKIDRESCIQKIEQLLGIENNRPEKNTDKIAWFSLQVDENNRYVENSFSLSPILWAIERLQTTHQKEYYPSILTENEYKKTIDYYESLLLKLNEELDKLDPSYSISTSCFDRIKNEIMRTYVHSVEENNYNSDYALTYTLFGGTDAEGKYEETYTGLSKNFFAKDISLVKEIISNNKYHQEPMIQALIDYICSANDKFHSQEKERYDLISKENTFQLKETLLQILNLHNAPVGKWASRFQPVLMQQVAINLATGYDKKGNTIENVGPIFSVNGPPGTGKTTLLKEIVANNVVERAKILSSYDDPDSAFERCCFQFGEEKDHGYLRYYPYYYNLKDDTINNYSILVASSNNAAVENITKELPLEHEILKNLQSKDSDDVEMTSELEEIRELFSVDSHCEEDFGIYFSESAKQLLRLQKSENAWGLISAALGKRGNIQNFCRAILPPKRDPSYPRKKGIFYCKNDDLDDCLNNQYPEIKKKFLEQLQIVEEIQQKLCKPYSLQRETDEMNSNYETSKFRLLLGKKNFNLLQSKQNEYQNILFENKQAKLTDRFTPLDGTFFSELCSDSPNLVAKANLQNPWITEHYNREREKLFYYAIQMNKAFVLSSKCCRSNIRNLLAIWKNDPDESVIFHTKDIEQAMGPLLQTLFLFIPVISTTFAAVGRFLKDIKTPGIIGTLIVDEAGQAQPHAALGSLFRSRRAIIVGDPKQIEPVVTEDVASFRKIFQENIYLPYIQKDHSVQSFADYLNPFGTYLTNDDNGVEWVGCPLIVHRRCISPMFDISNKMSYDGIMIKQTPEPSHKQVKCFYRKPVNSWWYNVSGKEKEKGNHFILEQGETAVSFLNLAYQKNGKPYRFNLDIYIITPFQTVAKEMKTLVKTFFSKIDGIDQWVKTHIGTVHTFQGKEANEVIFVLGCDRTAISAVRWVKKNLVNVAVTRAKYRLYVIGDLELWKNSPWLESVRQEIFDDNSNLQQLK